MKSAASSPRRRWPRPGDFLGFCTRARDGALVFSDVAAGQVMAVVGLEGASVAELLHTMLTHHIDALPIVGEGRKLTGPVTSTGPCCLRRARRCR